MAQTYTGSTHGFVGVDLSDDTSIKLMADVSWMLNEYSGIQAVELVGVTIAGAPVSIDYFSAETQADWIEQIRADIASDLRIAEQAKRDRSYLADAEPDLHCAARGLLALEVRA